MSMTLNERNPNIAIIPLGSGASASTVTAPGLYFRKHSRIKGVWFIDQAGIAQSASNFETITLQDNSSAPVAYAAVTMSAVAAVVNTQLAMALSTPVGDVANNPEADVPAGTLLNVKCVGTGTAKLTNAICVVEWYPV